MAVVLSQGAATLINDGELSGPVTMQVIGMKSVKEAIYRAKLSDGAHMVSVIIKGKSGKDCAEGLVAEGAIVTVQKDDFLKSTVQNKKLLFIQDFVVVEKTHAMIGGPVEIKADASAAGPSETAAMEVEAKPSMTSPSPKGPALSSPANTPPKATDGSPSTSTPLNMSQGAERIAPISDVNPYAKLTIRGRVITKDDMRSFPGKNGGQKSVFSVTIMDDTMDIKATFWDDVATRYYDVLEVGKSYIFSKGNCKMANQKFNITKSEYEMSFNNDAIIEICRDVDAPVLRFSFVAIDKLDTMIGKNVDVIGVVTEVMEMGEITIKTGRDAGKQKPKRNISIADKSGKQITLTLWDDNASKIEPSAASEHQIVAVRAVRVSDYGGCSINTTRGSAIQLDPEMPEAKAMREWYDSRAGGGAAASFQAVGGGVGGGAGGGPAPRKMISDIESEGLGFKEKPDYFSLRCTVVYVNTEKTWQYPSNPENKRKVTEEGGAWRDEKTGQIMDKCERRFIFSASFADLTGPKFLTVFDDDAKKIFGMNADSMYDLSLQDDTKFQQTFKSVLFKEMILKVRAKSETYQEETRVKCSVVSAAPVNYRDEGRLMLENIRKYGIA